MRLGSLKAKYREVYAAPRAEARGQGGFRKGEGASWARRDRGRSLVLARLE